MASDDGWLSQAKGMSPAQAAENGVSGVILAIFGGAIMLIESFFNGLSRLEMVLNAAWGTVSSLVGVGSTILDPTAAASADALTNGAWSFLGPFTFAGGVAAIVAAWMLWTRTDPGIPVVDSIIPWR